MARVNVFSKGGKGGSMPERWELRQLQSLPLAAKVSMTENRIRERVSSELCYSLDAVTRISEGGKMKRIIAIIILTLLILAPCGCACNEAVIEADNERLWTLEKGLMYVIYVDNLTGVQYLRTYNGGVCVMVDVEGRPLIWEGAE